MASINATTSSGIVATADNTGTLQLQTAGTTAIGINASQLVGIGNSSPSNSLSISNPSIYAALSFDWTGDNAAKAKIGANHSTGEVQYWATTNYFPTFYAGNSERMRIDTSGNLLLGTTTPLQSSPYPNHSIQIKSSDFPQISYQNSSAATSGSFWLSGQSSNDYWYLLPQPQNKGVYLTYTSTTGWSSFSDETLKENLVPIENALNKINTLRTVTGNFIDDPDTPHVFLIAQDVKAVLPEAVHMNLDHNVLGMNYNEIIPLLTAGIKELKAENDTLKTQLSELKTRIETLEAK